MQHGCWNSVSEAEMNPNYMVTLREVLPLLG
jgi:hypothetical protein